MEKIKMKEYRIVKVTEGKRRKKKRSEEEELVSDAVLVLN